MNEVKILNIGGSDQNIKDQYARNIIAPSENNLTAQDQPYASRDYDEGDYLIGQDRNLYKALTDIQTGDILAVNVNIKATTISDELVALEDSSVEEALEVIAYTENSSLSTRAYTIGDNLYWNYGASQGLYKATAVIAIGDALAVGSNIEAAEPIAKQLEVVDDEVATIVNELSAKNYVHINYQSQTVNGLTIVVDANGRMTISGNAERDTALEISDFFQTPMDSNTFTIEQPTGDNDAQVIVRGYLNETYVKALATLRGTDTKATFTNDYDGYNQLIILLYVKGGTTINTRLGIMVRPSSIADDTYAPYAMTNRELTEHAIGDMGILNSQYGIYYQKVSGMVTVRCIYNNKGIPKNTILGTLPAGCIPGFPLRVRNYNGDVSMAIDSNGNVTFTMGDGGVDSWINLIVSFPANQ